MAVTIQCDYTLKRGMRGNLRMIWGNVTLDGSNPTAVDLSGYLAAINAHTVSWDSVNAPAADPSAITSNASGTTINVYGWKVTGQADTTLIASTNNAAVVNFMAVGPKK